MGPRYAARRLPRLLFLSLDSGSAPSDPQKRTIEAQRSGIASPDLGPENRHWHRTSELAHRLLRQFKEDLELLDARQYFAHANSAKCCQNKPHRGKADGTLFENCRRFVPGELRALRPDVVVTQGGEARKAILRSFDVRCHVRKAVEKPERCEYKMDARYETGVVEIEPGTKCLWIQTYHPGCFGLFNPQRKYCWPLYEDAVRRFWRLLGGNAAPSED